MQCRCQDLVELEGNEATQYARDHLQVIKHDGETYTSLYRCPDAGIIWLKDPSTKLPAGRRFSTVA